MMTISSAATKRDASIFNSVEKGSDDDAGLQILQFIARPSAPYDCLQAMNAQATWYFSICQNCST